MLLLNGCCRTEMKKLQRQKIMVDAIVTDPPYHLTSIVERFGKEGSAPAKDKDGAFKRQSVGFMGKEWDGGDIAFDPMTWSLCLGLLKPGGHLIAFSASRNYHRMAVAIEDAGFEIRDQIMWLYGSGFPKSLNIGKAIDKRNGVQGDVIGTRKVTPSDIGQKSGWNHLNTDRGDYEYREIMNEWEGWGTALKPSHEPIVLARKPLSEKSIVDNVLKWGTGAINIDDCRIEGEVNRPPTNPSFRDVAKEALARGGLDKLSFGQDRDRPIKRKKVVRKSRDEDGVWTDGNSGMDNEQNSFADADPRGRFPANVMHDGSDVVRDIFPDAKSVKGNPRTATIKNQTKLNNSKEVFVNHEYDDEGSASRYFYCPKTSKSERHNGAIKNTHPTVKPIELMKYLCRLVTPKGGTVLDPFMGSGSTGMAAKDEGFDFIGIEKEPEYYDIAEARIKKTAPLFDFMT
tara:strand:+ start:371 stop:1741 length:1371 start_codon:yes stop_codon:yes gene_type:complete